MKAWVWVFATFCLALTACPSKSEDGKTDGGIDASIADAVADDGQLPDGTPTDASDCTFDIPLGDPCQRDCDCVQDLVCRGLPGEQVCAVGCSVYEDCQGVLSGCANAICDMNFAVCRCYCETEGCGAEQCVAGYCVGCSDDTHCAAHPCSATPGLDTPKCRLDTETCVCGGECGDGVCDEIEQALGGCPEDCPSPCDEGAVLAHYCPDGQPVPWCLCTGGNWDCSDPMPLCAGDNDCRRMGGYCVALAGDCYNGQVAQDPYGCTTPGTLCCLAECVVAGMTHPPGEGICCPGLKSVDSLMLMESFDPQVEGMTCEYGCWQQICVPCGDGACQFHLGENFCNCPEDCPHPPYDLVCSGAGYQCGEAFCTQQGTVCHEEAPVCLQNRCTYDTTDLAGYLCNPVTLKCEAP